MRTLTHIAAYAPLVLLTVGCGRLFGEHVRGAGDVEKKTLTVASFHGIVVDGPMDVVLAQGPVQSVVLEAQPNIAALVTTEVKDGTWTIATSKNFSTYKTFVVRISAPTIDVVEVEGSGDVKGTGRFTGDAIRLEVDGSGGIVIACDMKTIDASVSGSGNIRISGSCTSLKVAVGGSGDIDAHGLRTVDARADVSGSGDIALNATGEVDASVNGSGGITIHGTPVDVRRNVVGSGDVRTVGAE